MAGRRVHTTAVVVAIVAALCLLTMAMVPESPALAAGASQPVDMAAPYEFHG